MMITAVALLSCLLVGGHAEGVSPVQKVIQILEENKVKVTNDLAGEEKEMAEYTDFCDKEASERGYAIETAARTIEDLKATIEECNARIPARESDVEKTANDVAAKTRQLHEASELRKKEKADFDAAEGELVKAVDQLSRAVTIIKRETGAASFAQLSSDAKTAGSKGLEMALAALGKIVDSGRINAGTRRSLEGLMQTEDYQQLRQPQAKEVVYESKSGGIIAKIEEMKEKAEETLSEQRNAEMRSNNDFQQLEQSLNNGITVANEKIGDAKTRISARTQEKAQASGDLVQTEASKKADENYVATLKHDCEEAASNWAQRQESARGEIGAINKAIEILSEGVRVLLQVGSKDNRLSHYEEDDSESSTVSSGSNTDTVARSALVQKLKDMSHKFGSYALMEMAGSAAMDPFVKIRNLIEEMIAKLLDEAQEEATQKAFCDEEMGKSAKSKDDKTRTLDKLQSRIDRASSRKAELAQAVKDLEAGVAELDKSQAVATKIRNEEHATYLQASKDFGDAANAIERAIKVLKEFYDNQSLLQVGSQRSASKASAPDFGGAKGDAASVIISILEMSGEDFTKLHSETETNEDEAQEAYDKLTNDNKASKGAKQAEVKASLSEIKSLHVALKNNEEDHSMTSSELGAVMDYIEKLKPQCESKAMSYAEKKARREAEIEGLKEALEILAGDALALVQTQRHLRH